MKIGWLVWKYGSNVLPELWVTEPGSWVHKAVQIVYAEVVE